MSSILKALKRLEEEKAAKYGERVDSAGGILRGSVGSRRSHAPLVVGAVAVTAAVAVVVTYALMGGFGARPKPAEVPVTPQRMAEPMPPVPLLQPAAPVKPVLPAAAPTQARPAGARPAVAPVTPPAAVVAPPEPVQPRLAPPVTAPTPVPAQAAPVLPSLRVSAIAWQKEGGSLIAMVNGKPVGTGETVGGARVEEIFPDRVRFSHEGRSFEILLGKSAPEK